MTQVPPWMLLLAIGCSGEKTPSDTGSDTSSPVVDTGTPPTDTGTPPPTDSGTAPPDSGTTDTVDTGSTPTTDTADSGTLPTTDTGTSFCLNPVVARFPADGETDAYYETAVRFTLPSAEASAVVDVADAYGNVVPGNTVVEGTVVTWRGDPLAPLTSYTATLRYSCGTDETTFTTSEVGQPLTVDPTGSTWLLDIPGSQFVVPTGVGPLLASQVEPGPLIEATGLSTVLSLRVGAYDGVEQDLCAPTTDVDAGWIDPDFTVALAPLTIEMAGLQVPIDYAVVTGSIAPDGSRIQGGVLTGQVDTRVLGPALGLGTTYGTFCSLVATFGVSCTACPDGGIYCLDVRAEDIDGLLQSGVSVEPRTPDDIAADTGCP